MAQTGHSVEQASKEEKTSSGKQPAVLDAPPPAISTVDVQTSKSDEIPEKVLTNERYGTDVFCVWHLIHLHTIHT